MKTRVEKVLYFLRDLRSGELFKVLLRFCRGKVLDVGGWDFFLTARKIGVTFDSWTILEPDTDRLIETRDERVRLAHGDGCAMDFPAESFDTVLGIQVLEHVFEPIKMVEGCARVLKQGGHLILMVPQTATLHYAPHHYQNITRYWLEQAVHRAGLTLVSHQALGGFWSTIASRLVYFFLQAARAPGMSDPTIRRPLFFYVLFPLMALSALLAIPACLLFSLGDLAEEPNNHLVVARKPSSSGFPSVIQT